MTDNPRTPDDADRRTDHQPPETHDTDPDTTPETMTDHHSTTPDDSTFTTETIKKLGERGTAQLEHVDERTDPDTMSETKEVTVASFCNCGEAITDLEDTYRCCRHDCLCCTDCRIHRSRKNYCPDCAEEAFNVTKGVFLALYLLKKGHLAVDDLVQTDTIDTGEVTVQVDTVATTLVTHDYIQLEDTPTDTVTVGDDDPVTAAGQEALAVGDDLYSDDPEIEALQEDLRIQEIANNGP